MNRGRPVIDPEKQAKIDERLAWHKLVVKIISWKDATLYLKQIDKITRKEWSEYCKQKLIIGVNLGREKTMQSLDEIKQLIKKNGGFQ